MDRALPWLPFRRSPEGEAWGRERYPGSKVSIAQGELAQGELARDGAAPAGAVGEDGGVSCFAGAEGAATPAFLGNAACVRGPGRAHRLGTHRAVAGGRPALDPQKSRTTCCSPPSPRLKSSESHQCLIGLQVKSFEELGIRQPDALGGARVTGLGWGWLRDSRAREAPTAYTARADVGGLRHPCRHAACT